MSLTTDGAPPFRFTRESRIRIDADGHVWHEDERVIHPRLERALASWVDFDDEAGRYVLRNALDWCFITVDRAPLVVRHARVDDSSVTLELSDGTTEALDSATLHLDPEGVVYAYVRGGTLLARFDRSAAFTLLEHADQLADGSPVLHVGGESVAMKHLSAGALPPPRPEKRAI